MQEAVLLLLISEYLASQEVILNRSSELAEARVRTLNNTTAVYDLLAVALVRKGYFGFLSKTLERSLKFSFQEFHIWYQFALSLISARKLIVDYEVWLFLAC
ncbi:unnamed protein product [Protopolystoma xenopodis]|uniref:Tetratricopeptide repeat protein 7 N-terminal domain-containing protein n=1 Tax=Protopolystoma xenopodis TaxID=117903 RepID=A0A3S5AAE4_9PLAT|nr:unnamed protein product [Protopolystoma xenopodis]